MKSTRRRNSHGVMTFISITSLRAPNPHSLRRDRPDLSFRYAYGYRNLKAIKGSSSTLDSSFISLSHTHTCFPFSQRVKIEGMNPKTVEERKIEPVLFISRRGSQESNPRVMAYSDTRSFYILPTSFQTSRQHQRTTGQVAQ